MTSFTRTDTSLLSEWWWTVDRWMLIAVGVLILTGLILSLAASPAVARRLDYDSFHFVYRHAAYMVPALGIMLSVSLLTPQGIRRLSAALVAAGGVLMLLAILIGPEINGAHRWLRLGPVSVQPSEFVKPAFVVMIAWFFAERNKGQGFPGTGAALFLWGAVVTLLVLQPDFGQAFLVTAVAGAVFFLAGMPMAWVIAIAFVGLVGSGLAYSLVPHVASRIDRFVDPSSGDTYQVDAAMNAFAAGGLFGRGPGEGMVKSVLPDAHTDYIFAVAGEEFGILVCFALMGLFAFLVLRGLARALSEEDHFVQLAAAGLIVEFGLQAIINMGVNLNLLPSKGMTLPFISYGGSSLVALAMTMGMVLALTRRNAGHARVRAVRKFA